MCTAVTHEVHVCIYVYLYLVSPQYPYNGHQVHGGADSCSDQEGSRKCYSYIVVPSVICECWPPFRARNPWNCQKLISVWRWWVVHLFVYNLIPNQYTASETCLVGLWCYSVYKFRTTSTAWSLTSICQCIHNVHESTCIHNVGAILPSSVKCWWAARGGGHCHGLPARTHCFTKYIEVNMSVHCSLTCQSDGQQWTERLRYAHEKAMWCSSLSM